MRRAAPTRPRRGRGAEDGYVLALFALVLVSLLAFTGFGVDVGAWYSRAAQIQRAVDAAAMAGVVYLPADFPQAQSVACDTLERNGIDCADTAEYDVSFDMLTERRLRVTVRDKNVEAHFAKIFMDRIPNGMVRRGTAEYVLPVPLGSPESRLGTGGLTWSGVGAQNFWAAVSPFCTPKEMGDQLSSWTDGQNWGPCPSPYGSGVGDTPRPQPDYRVEGYDFYVEIPAGSPAVHVQIYDAGFCPSGGAEDFTFQYPGHGYNAPFETEFRLYEADTTPLDETDNVQFGATMPYGGGAGCGAWSVPFTIPVGAPPGRWRLNVRTQPGVNVSGHNQWGLWARRSSDTKPCNTLTSPGCPKVYAAEQMSVTANQGGSTATFYLAEIDPVHAGKHLEIRLWDPGDGMHNIQILDPNGTPADFRWRTTGESNDYGWTPATTCGSARCLRVDGAGPTPSNKPNRTNTIKFNDRLVVLDVQLPNSFASYPNNWWRIRYTAPSGGDVFDRTTWGATVVGDPVHLVNG